MIEFPNLNQPSDDDSMALYMALGSHVFAWGLIENGMNMMIAVIHHHVAGSPKERDEPLPFTMDQKFAYLRNAFSDLTPLRKSRYHKRIRPLLDEIDKYTPLRTGVVHGYFCGYDPATGLCGFCKLDGGGTIHRESMTFGTIPEIALRGTELIQLSSRLSKEMTALGDEFLLVQDAGNDATG